MDWAKLSDTFVTAPSETSLAMNDNNILLVPSTASGAVHMTATLNYVNIILPHVNSDDPHCIP